MDAPYIAERSPLWMEGMIPPEFPSLDQDIEADVAIIGGGFTGLTAAVLLQRAGKRVVLLERYSVAAGVSGATTAHLTEALDTRYHTLRRDFGDEGARLAALGTRRAINWIHSTVHAYDIDCGFTVVPGYLYSEREEDMAELGEELNAARAAGLSVELKRELPLPFHIAGALQFANQAEIHPEAYLYSLARIFQRSGGLLFEGTAATSIEDGELCQLVTDHGVVRAPRVIVAADAPLTLFALQAKVANYRSYVIAFPGSLAPALFWDMADPYHYLRGAKLGGIDFIMVGGEDHKTGQDEHTEARFDRLTAYAHERFGIEKPSHTWSAQVVEPVDGLPYIGKSPGQHNVFVATGFSGNGTTFGTLAGILLDRLVRGEDHPLAALFDPSRIKPLASARDLITENIDFPTHLVSDRVMPADADSLDEVACGEGKLVKLGTEKVAVYRDEEGKVHAVSPVCTHLGCNVHWNGAEKSWDCPCHGARYGIDGAVLHGPALIGLARKEIT